MSINSMTNEALAYRVGGRQSSSLLRSSSNPEAADSNESSLQSNAFTAIVAYIPTEIVTVYVAVLASISDVKIGSMSGQWVAMWTFLALTPATTWAVYAAKYKALKNRVPLKPMLWPLWEMFSASLAFVVWAYALPTSPFTSLSWYEGGLGTALLLVVSLVLGLLSPLFQPTK